MDGKEKLLKVFEEKKEEFAVLVADIGVVEMLKVSLGGSDSGFDKKVLHLCSMCSQLLSAYGVDNIWEE